MPMLSNQRPVPEIRPPVTADFEQHHQTLFLSVVEVLNDGLHAPTLLSELWSTWSLIGAMACRRRKRIISRDDLSTIFRPSVRRLLARPMMQI
jgi:hypothetical protein